MYAKLSRIRMSPLKVNIVADLVRGKSVENALTMLRFLPKKAAKILEKVVASAASNAVNNFQQNRDQLYVKTILVNAGPSYKRFLPASRGRAHPLVKRTAHITVYVETK